MNIILKISILLISIFLGFFIILSILIDPLPIKNNIEQALSKQTKSQVKIKGDVAISFLPLSKIEINNIEFINNNKNSFITSTKIKKVTFGISFVSLLKRDPEIKNITLTSPSIISSFAKNIAEAKVEIKDKVKKQEANNVKVGKTTFMSKLFNFNNSNLLNIKKIRKIEVTNGNFQKIGLGKEVILNINKIDLISFQENLDKNFELKGSSSINDIPSKIELYIDLDGAKIVEIDFKSSILSAKLRSEVTNENSTKLLNSNLSGNLNIIILNPKEFSNKYFSKYNLLYNKVNSIKPINISANIDSLGSKLDISNIIIKSDMINGSGNANIEIIDKNININSELNIINLDLDQLWLPRFTKYNDNIIKYENKLLNTFLQDYSNGNITNIINYKDDSQEESAIKSKITSKIEIEIEEIKLLQDYIRNTNIALSLNNGLLNISNVEAELPNDSKLTIVGDSDYNDNYKGLLLNINIQGGDFGKFLKWSQIAPKSIITNQNTPYKINSNALFLSNFSAFRDFNLELNNKKEVVNGNIRIDNSKEIADMNINFNINELELNKYLDFSLERNKYLSPGSLLNKLLWLKTVNSNNNIYLNIEKLQYHDSIFLNQAIDFKIGRGIFKIESLRLKPKGKKQSLQLSILADIQSKPKLEIDIKLDNFSYQDLELEDNRKFKRLPFADRFFYLPTLIDFNGQINIDVNNSAINNIILEKVYLSGPLDGGIWSLDNNFDMFGGNVSYKGNIVIRNIKSVSGSFIFNQINNNKFLDQIFDIKNISGLSNASGIINSSGIDKKEFSSILDIKSQFISSNISIKNFGISDIQKSLLFARKNGNKNIDINNIIFKKSAITKFKEAKGSFDVESASKTNKFIASASTPGLNSVTNGSVDLSNNSFKGITNAIFITGTARKQIPINIAIGHNGPLSNLKHSPNLSQIEQYLKQLP